MLVQEIINVYVSLESRVELSTSDEYSIPCYLYYHLRLIKYFLKALTSRNHLTQLPVFHNCKRLKDEGSS